jgi:two-component system, cell cycle sensor histidine kinase and response regulator CckA
MGIVNNETFGAAISQRETTTAVITLDPVGDVQQWSYAAETMTGYAAAEIVGRPLATLLSEQQAGGFNIEQVLKQAVQGGHSQIEGWLRRKDGAALYTAQSFTALFERSGGVSGFSLMLRDLTHAAGASARGQSEQQLRQAQRMEAVGRLASGVAHDFNNLLTAIQGHAQFLAEDLESDHPSRADVEEILHSSERAAALTRQLLAFSRGQVMQPETVQLNQVITMMERLLRRVISEDIAVESVLADKLWTVRADPSQLEQVLVNLIVNARDAMPRGGRITIKTANAELVPDFSAGREDVIPGEYAMLAVSDTGAGMDRETQARIFEPFFTTKTADKGTGLGLSTVFGIIKQMSGHIFVYSEPGHGTTFKIYLPRADGSAVTPKPPKARGRARSRERVLVVEDDDSVRSLAGRVLESRGYRVSTCASVDEAIEILQEAGDGMSLVISDVVMPGSGGHELSGLIRERWPDVGVLFMSGYTDDDVRRHGLIGDEESFIEKPFTPEGLAQKVRDTLDELAVNLPQNQR